ncbi:chaplin [Streptomyces sp. UNOC14_S4]|uniref:chaplin n=1 Tax=Streptomyces sp. UNOC14_S4 TaxID=2872340 RepID=UPI001E459750|nr:chaplin [Streptomyces sp. UNOC14_S4]MCC3769144.1 chaplin [Streptomyces sp. UNOC14_S4]
MNTAKKAALILAATGMALTATAGAAVAHDGGKGSVARGVATHSPGIVSGDVIQIPVDVPLNVCGNTIDILLAILNPTFGNTCINSE